MAPAVNTQAQSVSQEVPFLNPARLKKEVQRVGVYLHVLHP